uniref:Matrix metallopeptidase 11 n=1 Tax=Coturnix japonica TaxID=93934 RepID=A0A8C2TBL2_COTJA
MGADEQAAHWNPPRCGVPDLPVLPDGQNGRNRQKRFVLSGGRWDKTDLTYKIIRFPWQLVKTKVRRTIEEALKVWSDVTPLTFTEVQEGRADIVIDFTRYWHGDNLPFDGPGGILAHAFFPKTHREGDVHFDYDETWTIGNNLGTDLLQVAAHEFGHVLGLQHTTVSKSLMSPFYIFRYPLSLSEDDKQGIQYLYGKPKLDPNPTPTQPAELPQPDLETNEITNVKVSEQLVCVSFNTMACSQLLGLPTPWGQQQACTWFVACFPPTLVSPVVERHPGHGDVLSAEPSLGEVGSHGSQPLTRPCFGRLCSPMLARQLLMLQPPSEESCSSSHLATCGGSELESCKPATQLWPHVTGRGSQALSMPPSRTLWAISGFSKVRAGLGSDGSEVNLFLQRGIQDTTSPCKEKPLGYNQQIKILAVYFFLCLSFLLRGEESRKGHFYFRHSQDTPFSSSGTQLF